KKVLAVDKCDLDVGVTRERLLQMERGVESAEAAARDDDPCLFLRAHVFAPLYRHRFALALVLDVIGAAALRRSASLAAALSSCGLRLLERRSAEVDAEALAPDRDGFVLVEIDTRGQIIILIADVAFERTDLDEASVFDRVAVGRICGGDEIDVPGWHVGSFNVGQ